MARVRKFIGLWIVAVVYVGIPALYYLAARWLDRALGAPVLSLGDWGPFLAAISVFAGLFWATWAYSYLHFVGGGTPVEVFGYALHPTERLVTTGPYAYSRNPMLIGMIFLLLAAAFYGSSALGLVLVPAAAIIALVYIEWFEEPVLERRFGDRYAAYRRHVPALLPSWKPYAIG